MKIDSTLIAVKGKSATRTYRTGDANHLSQDGQTTLCGILVYARINHLAPVSQVWNCQNCKRTGLKSGLITK